jgi:peptide/nickel transport system permease protein
VLRFLLRRGGMLLGTLLVASFAIYGALDLAPGSPIAALTGGRAPSAEALAELTARYHLDQPFLLRYWSWVTAALHGDLGESISLHENVSTLIGQRIGVTVELVALTAVVIAVVGVGLGLAGALAPGAVDTGVLFTSTVSAAMPSFAAAVVLQFLFAVQLGWFPAFGTGQGFGDGLRHLVLPALALAATSVALVTRVTRAAVREELQQEHVQTAVSRGLPWPDVVRRHVLRNAAIPITTVVGLTVAGLLALSAVVETAFGLNGLGAYLVQAALNKDFAVVQGISLVLVVAFVLTNVLVDLAYAVLDPSVTLGSRAR